MLISTFHKYLTGKRCSFFMTPERENDRNEIVVLAHGLIRRSLNLYSLGRYLRKHGYTVYIYDYKTTRKTIAEHGEDFRRFLIKIAGENPPERKINLVTHSMGGIIAREALDGLSPDTKPLSSGRIKRIVMLAPPNKGSDAARRVIRVLPFTRKWIKPLAELSSDPESYIHQVPVPEHYEVGIIAARFDFEVSRKYTHLYGQTDHIVLNSDHSFIMYMPNIRPYILRFLESGRF